jgi:hypothetical protein
MTQPPYPIVEEKSLGPTERGGPFGLGRHRREYGEVPRAKGEQVRVFLVDGKHVVDHGQRGDDDEQIVRAAHVSVVDLSRNYPVHTELTIPSADAEEFTIRVTFLCTVTDPVTVIREGTGDAERVLQGYVRSHHRLFQLGLDQKISDVNRVRLNVQTQIEAYVQLKPPPIRGMSVSLASVEVLTPEELVTLHGRLRSQEGEHLVASGREELAHELERLKAEHAKELERRDQERELDHKRYSLQLEQAQQYLREMEQVGRQRLSRSENEFTAAETAKLYEAYDGDSIKAAIFANRSGELTDTDMADRLRQQEERQEAEQRAEREHKRELERDERARRYALEDAQRDVERLKLERVYALEDSDRELERMNLDRAYATEQAVLERLHVLDDANREMERERLQREYDSEQAKLQRQHAVEDASRTRELDREIREREDRLHLLRIRLDMLKEIAKHGHIDEIVVNPEQLIGSIAVETGAVPGPVNGHVEAPAALREASTDPEPHDDEGDLVEADSSAFREEES